MGQRNIIFPQGRAANIVNSSIIYHIMLFFYILGTLEKKETAISMWWFCPELLTARVRQGALSKYLTDLGLDRHGGWLQPCGSGTQNYYTSFFCLYQPDVLGSGRDLIGWIVISRVCYPTSNVLWGVNKSIFFPDLQPKWIHLCFFSLQLSFGETLP